MFENYKLEGNQNPKLTVPFNYTFIFTAKLKTQFEKKKNSINFEGKEKIYSSLIISQKVQII